MPQSDLYITNYYIIPNLDLHSIVGLPLYLSNKMFKSSLDNSIMPTSLFATIAYYPVNGCTVIDGQIIPTAVNATFKLAYNHSETISFYNKPSMQPPIRISDIKTTIGVNSNNLSALNTANAINLNSPCRPTKTAPYSMGQWINYCHTASAGVALSNYTLSTSNLTQSQSTYNCRCTITQKDMFSTDYQLHQLKVDFYNTNSNTSVASQIYTDFDYYLQVDLASSYRGVGTNTIQCRIYLLNYSSQWVLMDSQSLNIYYEQSTSYSLAGVNYTNATVRALINIFNGGIAQTFDVVCIVTANHDYTKTVTTATINQNTNSEPLLTFAMGHIIDENNDLFTIRIKPSTSSTWESLCEYVSYSSLPYLDPLN